jgi:hypothetical protein
MQSHFTFQSEVWLTPGDAGWHFITLPVDTADQINFFFGDHKRGWGSLPVNVTIGDTVWKTSIFTDKKASSFLLPLKSEVRKNERIVAGDTVSVELDILINV